MRRRIKTKIIANVSIIVTLALLMSGVFAYNYFYDILKRQIMNDEWIKINQTAGQLRYVQDDIRQLAQYILVDSEIQSRINAIYSSDPYERLSAEDWLKTKLNRYLLLKNWIESIVLVDNNGHAVSTNSSLNDYYSETLKEEWYMRYTARNVYSGFSEVHTLIRGQEAAQVISYIIRFNPLLDRNSKLHQLIIHVNASYISNVLPADSQGYESYYLLGAQNQVMVGKGSFFNTPSIRIPLGQLMQHPIYQGESSKQIITINGMIADDWKLVTVKPKNTVQHDINSIMYIFILTTIITILVILLVLTPLILNITRPISRLTKAMKEAAIGRLQTKVTIRSGDEIELLGEGFNRMTQDLQKYISQSVEDEKIKEKLRYDLLLSQINPHFIYNTLNTVIYMAQRDGNADIIRMVDAFIRLLQSAVLIEEAGHQCSIEEEMESVKNYLIIQNFRYPERFEVKWRVEEKVLSRFIPRTILQPLIENALFHGIIPKPDPGTITVVIEEDQGHLCIEVDDDGIGIDYELIERFEHELSMRTTFSRMKSIGLVNIRDRIQAFCGSASALRISRLPGGGTRIRIVIPLSKTAGFYTK